MNREKHKKANSLKSKIDAKKSEIEKIKIGKTIAESSDNYFYIGTWNNTIKIPKDHQKTFITLIDSALKDQLETLEKEYQEL